MATHTNTHQPATLLLRRTLRGNGIFTSLCGILLILGAWPLTSFLGLGTPLILIVIGVVLLPYAVSLFFTAARELIDHRSVLIAALLDSAWVLWSVVILLTNWIPLTIGGKWAVGVIAVIVALFAELEWYGLWRARAI